MDRYFYITGLVFLAATVGCGGDAGYIYDEQVVDIPESAETYDEITENDFISADVEPISTFSIDVDTASYTIMRSDVNEFNRLPAPDSVRVEEYVNYFDYDYNRPEDDVPFAIHLEMADSEFGEDLKLLRVALQGRDVALEDLKPTNLVFLIDVSGSMGADNKLPLVKKSLEILVDTLRPTDTIGIVTYASAERVALNPTEVKNRDQILSAIRDLESGGSTYGEAGIQRAYDLVDSVRDERGNNRVVICTDGDFNVGKTGDELFDYVDAQRERNIALTAVGFGRGNYNDQTMENIAKRSNGNYFYIDTLAEAERIFKTDITSTLEIIASDVKVQLEFNPNIVSRYRLIGYENRLLNAEDFDNDFVDAGEVGPGHNVTAFYEIELLEEQTPEALADFRVRYKDRFGDESKLIQKGIKSEDNRAFDEASSGFRFAAAVAEYAEILRESKHVDTPDIDRVIEIADEESNDEPQKLEFLQLAEKVKSLL